MVNQKRLAEAVKNVVKKTLQDLTESKVLPSTRVTKVVQRNDVVQVTFEVPAHWWTGLE